MVISIRLHMNQVIKVHIIINGPNHNCMPPDSVKWENITSVIFLLKIYNLGIIEKTSDKPTLEGHSTNNLSITS